MDKGPDFDRDLGQPLPRTADLLIRIAAILGVDPAFFLDEAACPAADPAAERSTDLRDLLLLFRSIDDVDARQAALNLLRLRRTREGED